MLGHWTSSVKKAATNGKQIEIERSNAKRDLTVHMSGHSQRAARCGAERERPADR